MGAAIIIRTTVVSRHADHIQPETLDRKTVKTKRRTLPLRKWRKGKPTDFEMVSEKLKILISRYRPLIITFIAIHANFTPIKERFIVVFVLAFTIKISFFFYVQFFIIIFTNNVNNIPSFSCMATVIYSKNRKLEVFISECLFRYGRI